MMDLAEAGAALLGGRLRRAEPLAGGDLSQILRIQLEDGRVAIVKNGPSPETEAAMLRAIRDAGAPAPVVLAVSHDALAMEELPAGGSLSNAWASLGTALAQLHSAGSGGSLRDPGTALAENPASDVGFSATGIRTSGPLGRLSDHATGPRYGWAADYAFGRVAIENGWSDDWPAFFAEQRLLTSVSQVPAALGRRLERLAADLPNRLPRHPPPSLLHGDLWGGNVVVEGARVSGLIDPACYYGHAEVDLAMLTLFDRPGPAFYAAYGPLEPGADERLVIYRLWPALVHLRLFGGGYRGMVEGFLTAAGV
jgi:fructosamine-3-kinase